MPGGEIAVVVEVDLRRSPGHHRLAQGGAGSLRGIVKFPPAQIMEQQWKLGKVEGRLRDTDIVRYGTFDGEDVEQAVEIVVEKETP